MNQKVIVFLLPNFIFGIFLFGFFCKRQKTLTGAFPDPAENWVAIQNGRKSTLASVCLKNNLNKLKSKLDSHVANQLFVEHKHKFIYCEVPKVGCSNWKRTIFLLQADLNAEASEIEHDHIHQTSLIKKLVSYPPAIQKEFLNNYTKVMFTRHPLERLVSAYRDKLLHSEPFYSITVANEIRAMFRKNKNSSEKVSFQEFVNFIIAKQPNTLDIHWKPMFLLCDPCNIHYDILGKYETLALDSEHVLKVIGAPESLQYPSLKRYGSEKRTNGDITLEYLRQLTSEQIEKIKKLYQMDFFLFNYTMKYEDYFSLND
ncbi:PREDICTED: carbohydrate sulfotransferase 9-like isoform X1 [Lepidothrix coronata]|uniref:Carbohydrate sulfotransferase n=1 Tax=Lepidothrix coronata TaxID=321398 RepID=A0A6J0GI75_9PASS|nr:PREDICTED: carbohydrate sulfotransferase 9-like isoform X1 [Lepidothrix coronata]XP_017661612.1 PREDICTED: carbohydrate sulfotransferase 9-like isoform X1 [Lepidothrix coronata]XP_017661621.1 PREDICTED: carbohydrate sulfotransferase 9-like isoform X1 [Lepidothrix coronata]XP_017661636.1 PREDICTED: carbohydrate sulfotransferase 9-like isoform X1 [Lepidothrix coronata]XP_017661644.1 PREDICTED: carbohydrate sulfotransferase 9-like isoform X1 [Lepidothrix coronata]XP_017661653.1 PREDICTED: carb